MRLGSLGSGEREGIALHSTLGEGRFRITQLSDVPDEQVAQTMRIMGERVTEDVANPIFLEFAGRVFQGVDSSDTPEVINRAFEHTRNAISFQRDEESGAGLGALAPSDLIEFIVRPVDMARYIDRGLAVGDCDDFSAYLAALLTTQGIDVKFCTVAADERVPDQFSHVYCVAYVDGERIPLDASHAHYGQPSRFSWSDRASDFVGYEVPNKLGRRTEWSTRPCSLFTIAAVAAAAWFGWRALEAA